MRSDSPSIPLIMPVASRRRRQESSGMGRYSILSVLLLLAVPVLSADCSSALAPGARSVGTVIDIKGQWVVRLVAGTSGDVRDFELRKGCPLPPDGRVVSTSPVTEQRFIVILSSAGVRDAVINRDCKPRDPCPDYKLSLAVPGALDPVREKVSAKIRGDPERFRPFATPLAGSPPDSIVELRGGAFDVSWFLQGNESGKYSLSVAAVATGIGSYPAVECDWNGVSAALSIPGIKPGLYTVSLAGQQQSAWMLLAPPDRIEDLRAQEAQLTAIQWPPGTEVDKRTVLRAFFGAAADEFPTY
jgi:hypothetical protein